MTGSSQHNWGKWGRRGKVYGAILVAGALTSTSLPASAAGFQLLEQSVAGLGRSFAGGSLAADDGSAAFYNPADMLLLDNRATVQTGAIYVGTESTFEGVYSFPVATPVNETAKVESVVPHLHWVSPLYGANTSDNNEAREAKGVAGSWRLGLSISSPFGLSTEYSDTWPARFETVSSELITTDINPSFAYQLSSDWSVGAGLSAQYAEVTLKSVIPGLNANAKVIGDDWSWGYNAGLTWSPDAERRLSLTYRSKVEHELEGEIDVVGAANGVNGSGDVTLPETVTFNFMQKVDSRMTALFSLRHTRWSRYEKLQMTFDVPVWNSLEVQNWHNTWSASFGTNYQYREDVIVRAGVGYDQSPVPSSIYRSPRLPATYNIWWSAGLSWQLSDDLALDFAYMYVDGKDAEVDYTGLAGSLNGKFDNASAHEAGIQLRYQY